MNPFGLAARIVAAVALFVALVMSFVSSFLVISIEMGDLNSVSAGTSAWTGIGTLGGLVVIGGFAVAVVSAALPTQLSVIRRVLAALVGSACLLAAGLFAFFLILEMSDLPSEVNDLKLRFGWSGYAALSGLAVGLVAAVFGAVLSDRPSAPTVQQPTPWP